MLDAVPTRVPSKLEVAYQKLEAGAPLGADTLAVVGFGAAPALPDDPRSVRVGLRALHGEGLVEVWRGSGPARCARQGSIRYACDESSLFGVLEVAERDHADMVAAAAAAYAEIRGFQADCTYPHLLRMWNYFDQINLGEGDAERYKQFCQGRAAALSGAALDRFPAATAIGRRDGERLLQVYWLASREPGRAIENPRQVSAFRYPRQYGPAAPSFSRAMLWSDRVLLISGTASVVGHLSRHPEDVAAQLDETLVNLDSLLTHVVAQAPALPAAFDGRSLLKVYLRVAEAAPRVEQRLRERLSPSTPFVILEADVCRSNLLVEIDVTHLG